MSLRELLFPRKCPFCGKLLEKSEGDVCGDCLRTLPWTGNHCRSRGSFFSLCVSPLYYAEKARDAVLRYKFARRSSYSRVFARLMAECVRRELDGQFECITYVPVSFRRYRQRGYSQSRLLAEKLARALNVPCVPMLKKVRHTEAQSHLKGEAARRANVSGAFQVLPNADVAGKHILLADDVVTTGATLSEVSRVLLTSGAEQVVCATLCRAGKRTKNEN